MSRRPSFLVEVFPDDRGTLTAVFPLEASSKVSRINEGSARKCYETGTYLRRDIARVCSSFKGLLVRVTLSFSYSRFNYLSVTFLHLTVIANECNTEVIKVCLGNVSVTTLCVTSRINLIQITNLCYYYQGE